MNIIRDIVFWDVDTQIDFMEPYGKLYVPGAEKLKANLAFLTEMGAGRGRLSGSADAHMPNDREFNVWPEHCVYGTPGQHKVPESSINGTLYVPSVRLSSALLSEVVAYNGQVIFEKQETDVRTNPNVKPFMNLIRPKLVVVYGVVSEICVNLAVDFFTRELGYETVVVVDAIKELDMSETLSCRSGWETLGVKMLNTRDIIDLLDGLDARAR
ncbi:cysteine hydrolase family protein [Thermoproteota archaeon]